MGGRRSLQYVIAGLLSIAVASAACGGGSSSSSRPDATGTTAPNATATSAPANEYPTPYPGVLGVISDFLVIQGTEFYPAIPPCSAYETTDDYAGTLLEFGFLPGGTEQTQAYVSRCPDGAVYSTGAHFDLPDGATMSIYYARAPYSYPVVLGDPARDRIAAVEVNGHRGLLIEPLAEPRTDPGADLFFWVEEQYDGQKAGAYVQVSIVGGEASPAELTQTLLQIGDGVEANVPAP